MSSNAVRRTIHSTAIALACAVLAAPAASRAADQPDSAVPPERNSTATATDDAATTIPMFGDLPSAGVEPAASTTEERRDNALLRRRGDASASSATPNGPATTPDSSNWLRTVFSLAAVTGLILLLAWGYRALMRGTGGTWLARPRQPAVLDVLARTAITQKLGLCLVRVGPRMVLVGVGTDRLTSLDVIDDAELTAKLAGRLATTRSATPRTAPEAAEDPDFRQLLAREADQALGTENDTPAESESVDGLRLLRLRGQLSGALKRLRTAAGSP